METFTLSSNGYVSKGKKKKRPESLPSLKIQAKPTLTSQLRGGASLPELKASASVHKFPPGRKQAGLARLNSRDDCFMENRSRSHRPKVLTRQRSKSHDPESSRTHIKLKGRLPSVESRKAKTQNIFNGNAILWKHQLPVQMSLFLHEEFDCIEVVTFDLVHNVELERLYVVASKMFSIVENHKEVEMLYDHKIAKSEAILNARINCTIDYLMCHLSSEKIAFMPVVPTLRRYNEKLKRREALTIPKPLWLVAGHPDAVCQIIGVLLAANCIRTATLFNTVKLRWRWAIKKVIGINRARKNIIYAWRRATMGSELLINMRRGESLDDSISASRANSMADHDGSGNPGDVDEEASEGSFLSDFEEEEEEGGGESFMK